MATIAKRAREMTPFIVMEVLERAEAMIRDRKSSLDGPRGLVSAL